MSQPEEQGNTAAQMVSAVNVPSVNSLSNGQTNGQFADPITHVTHADVVDHHHHNNKPMDDKKSDEPPKIKRPMNPFMIFGCEKRRKLAQVHPRMHNSEISKILGAEWKRMSEYEKAPYVQEAKRLKEQHSIEYPNYKFKANRRKPRQAVKKERPAFPYATDLTTIPTGMKYPYPSPFLQDSIYGSMFPGMPSGTHPAYTTMYSDYSSALARQAMVPVRGMQPPTTLSASTEYYSVNKTASGGGGGSGTPMNDYYAAAAPNKSSDYYPTMHTSAGATSRAERTTGAVEGNIDRYVSTSDTSGTRQFERYSTSFNGAGSQPNSGGSYAGGNSLPSLSSEAAYPLYEQRH